MTVKSEVSIYTKDGKDVSSSEDCIVVESVCQYSKMVILHVNGVRYEVCASDLQKAITNAQNS